MYLKKPGLPKEIAERARTLYDVLAEQVQGRRILRHDLRLGHARALVVLMYYFDQYVIDGLLVNGVGWLVQQFGKILSALQGGNVQRYATYIALGIVLALLAILFSGCTPVG